MGVVASVDGIGCDFGDMFFVEQHLMTTCPRCHWNTKVDDAEPWLTGILPPITIALTDTWWFGVSLH